MGYVQVGDLQGSYERRYGVQMSRPGAKEDIGGYGGLSLGHSLSCHGVFHP